jgi:hypothetical protein
MRQALYACAAQVVAQLAGAGFSLGKIYTEHDLMTVLPKLPVMKFASARLALPTPGALLPGEGRDPGDLRGTNTSAPRLASAKARGRMRLQAASAAATAEVSVAQVQAQLASLRQLKGVTYAAKSSRIRLLQSAACPKPGGCRGTRCCNPSPADCSWGTEAFRGTTQAHHSPASPLCRDP